MSGYLRTMSNVVKVGMTRPIVLLSFATAIMATAGCGQDPLGSVATDTQTRGWLGAPTIDSATRSEDGVQISGRAQPGSRIVMRGDPGTAFAVVTGEEGRFGLRLPQPAVDTLYVVEVQVGEDAIPSAARLLVASRPGGPLALITPGSPTRRLDPMIGLDVIDSDGRTRVASGRAVAGRQVAIAVDNAQATTVTTDRSGRWTLNVGGSSTSAVTIKVDGIEHSYPGEAQAELPFGRLTPAGRGVGLRWNLSDTAEQYSWFTIQGDKAGSALEN